MQENPTYEILSRQGKAGIKILYERYGKKLYSYAISSWKMNEDDAWEITYKALYQVCGKIESYHFEDEKAFSSFLFTVFINLLRNHFRDNKPVFTEPIENADLNIEVNPDQDTERPELALLTDELNKMEDWQRILLLLRCQDMPYAEIARFTGKSPDFLKVYYGRLKEKLGKKLNELLNRELR